MMNMRSNADESLVGAPYTRHSKGKEGWRKLYIADARPRKNALANGAMGGGSESSSNYFQCENFVMDDSGNEPMSCDSEMASSAPSHSTASITRRGGCTSMSTTWRYFTVFLNSHIFKLCILFNSHIC
ncbi:uncharacterized protein LOC143582049 [Bidens hawaiensis]|uniref:uncharacterized protein LOC143582049 n=1 Tax=Bidens hawaiensis TaxID=980011 RepID=UPI00404A0D31